MITKRKVIGTLDMGFDGCRHTADYAFKRLKKPDLTPSQLRWLVRRCATDLQCTDRVWRSLREYLIKDDTISPQQCRDLLRMVSEAEYVNFDQEPQK
jgi:hypothetical protein